MNITDIRLPQRINQIVDGKEYIQNEVGMSASDVYMFDDMVLKIQKVTEETENEAAILNRIGKNAADGEPSLFPKLIAYEVEDKTAYTLISRMKGDMLCDDRLMRKPEVLVQIAAAGLKALWSIDVTDCEFSTSRLENRLKAARYNVEHNLVDMDNVEPETFSEGGFKDPYELIDWLENNRPDEDIVFTHGDYCLPNVFAQGESIGGFIDLGKAGPADRWQDVALCLRSLRSNFDGVYTGIAYEGYSEQMLLDALGIDMDEEKYHYYLLLDELF